MIKVIAFDYSGVIEILRKNPMGEIARYLKVPVETFREEYFKHNHLWNSGGMTFREGVVFVANKFNLDHSKDREILELVDNCEKDTYMNDELLKLIPRLRKNGYKIGLISNYSAKLRQSLIVKKIDLLFDSIILSGEVGFQKPNREIFDCLFKNLNVKSSEVVFIDDTPKSLEKAEVIGYKPILFLNNEQLLADLIKLNVRV